ncbi:MAG TPA: deoxyribonuclease IV [Dehalococcoidia bacterium]|nr:deoxyribonuclease IV [Dehalococcoidia bacterium]
MRVGAHVSTSGGLDKAVDRAQAMGAETVQIFGAAPQTWRRRSYGDEETNAFREKAAAADIAPVFLHAIYLISLVSDDPVAIERSAASLVADLELCARIGAKGSIVHAGSHKGAGFEAVLERVAAAVRNVLAATPRDSWLILENSAGMGGSVGAHFSELGAIIREVDDPRVRVCLDTQHAFAMGYDLISEEGLSSAVDEFEREIGLDRLVACHANDSKAPLAGVRDRHENIGEGHIGRDGFRRIMSHPALADVPFIIEVPGFGNLGPDKDNLDILKEIRREAGAAP